MSADSVPGVRFDSTASLPANVAALDVVGALIGGRYRLGPLLGRGGSGQVHAAIDVANDHEVAIKLIIDCAPSEISRISREVAALRLLQFPGVVRLRGEGRDGDLFFIVMDRIDGTPFPGLAAPPVDWERIAPTVEALLECLARVHATGVLHRDLKPSNILVDTHGRPTLLDFGLSWGPELGSRITGRGRLVGTPQYLAPEQICGQPLDARTDLYALGVMLYESLGNRPPHATRDLQQLLTARLARPPIPLRRVAPAVPERVAQLIDDLLATDPAERPRSAWAALARLRAESGPEESFTLPRLGNDSLLHDSLAALRARRSIDICGAPGAGKSRLLRDLADSAQRTGERVIWALPSRTPFGSLEQVAATSEWHGASLDEHLNGLVNQLITLTTHGYILVADDWEALDEWSQQVIERCRGRACIVRASRGELAHALRIEPLSKRELQALFAGPDLVWHLREDAAHELHRRTLGNPARVVDEVRVWLTSGIARWQEEAANDVRASGAFTRSPSAAQQLEISRPALDRLRVGLPALSGTLRIDAAPPSMSYELEDLLCWLQLASPHASKQLLARATGQAEWQVEAGLVQLERKGAIRALVSGVHEALVPASALQGWGSDAQAAAHRKVAGLLPAGSEGRLQHLIAGGEDTAVVAEALVVARHCIDAGRIGDATAALAEAMAVARGQANATGAFEIAAEWTRAVFSQATVAGFASLQRELTVLLNAGLPVAPLVALVTASIAALGGVDRESDPHTALMLARALPTFEHASLEHCRQSVRILAAKRLGPAAHEAELSALEAEASATASPKTRANFATWRAHLLYTQGQFAAAARLHLEAAAALDSGPARIGVLLNAAASWLEANLLAEAGELAEEAAAHAAAGRLSLLEARAHWLLRSIAYRSRRLSAPNFELVDAVSRLNIPALTAQVCLTEAALAWRRGEHKSARELAHAAETSWRTAGQPLFAMLAHGLGRVAVDARSGGQPPLPEATLLSALRDCRHPAIAVQVIGLERRASGGASPQVIELQATYAEALKREDWHVWREVLAIAEALDPEIPAGG
ncbi:MAG: protein kinase domain-containing protein [Planctomycetota bacterium]